MDGPDPGGQQRRDQPLRGAAGVAQKGCGSLPAGAALRRGGGSEGPADGHAEAQQTSGEPDAAQEQPVQYTDLPLDAEATPSNNRHFCTKKCGETE